LAEFLGNSTRTQFLPRKSDSRLYNESRSDLCKSNGNLILPVRAKANKLTVGSFTFVDASHFIAKASLWEERDEVAYDKQARIGCKGKNKFAEKTWRRLDGKNQLPKLI
jgi:hypothetical protein